jgi:hypothetical protein
MPRTKKCEVKECGKSFEKQRMGQKVCGPKCAYKLVLQNKLKESRKDTAVLKKKFNEDNKSWWLDYRKSGSTAYWLHRYIRARDAVFQSRPCVSCAVAGPNSQIAAGHFKSVGSTPELRLHPSNINGQCSQCNTIYSGNQTAYEDALRVKWGSDRVDWLKGSHAPARFTLEGLRARRDMWKALAKQIEVRP